MNKSSNQKIIWYTLFLIFSSLGILTALFATQNLTPILFGGKSFKTRSEVIQYGLYFFFACGFSILYFLIGKLVWLSSGFQKIINEFIKIQLPKIKYKINEIENSSGLHYLLLFSLIFVAMAIIYVQIKLIFFPYPLELREGAVQLSTYALMHKINPYTIENNPVYINSFGVLYNAVILPFAFIFGNTLQLHRFLNAIFIIGQLTLMTIILRRQRTNWFVIAMVLLFMWIGQLFIAGPTARPDTLGELLFLSTLFIPVLNNFSKSSLIISGILGLLSFHTKIYFFLGPIIVSIYLFLFISKQKSLRYMLWVGGLLISSFLILNHFLETYFVNNIFPLFSYRFTSNYAHLIKQLIKFFRDYWSLLIISLGIFISISDKNQIPKLKIRTDIKHLKKPLFNIEFDFLLFCLVITSLMVFFLFGKHSGTYQTYFYHLITPFLTMSSLSLIDKYDRHKKGLIIIVVINLILHSYENLKPDFLNFDSPDWVKLNNYVMNSKEILNSPLDVSFLIEQEKPVAISGFTQYFFIYPKEPFFLMKEPQKLKDEASKYIKNIAGKIENKNYDFLETFQNEDYDLFLIGDKLNYPESDLNFISKYYHLVDFLYIPMPHSFEFWKMGIWKPISP